MHRPQDASGSHASPIASSIRSLRERLFYPILGLLIILSVGIVGYGLILNASIKDGLYQTAILLTGVGFDDVLESNRSWGGVLFTVFLSFLGLGGLLYILSTITAFIVEGELTQILETQRMRKRIANLNGHFILCGTGDTGQHVVEEMLTIKRPFVCIEMDMERIERLQHNHPDAQLLYLIADASDDEALIEAGIHRAKGLVTTLRHDKDNLLTVITARQLNPQLRIISRCVEMPNRRKLLKAGANKVVIPNAIGGMRMASELVRPSTVSFLDAMLRSAQHIRFEDLTIPEGHASIGKTLSEANIQNIAEVNVIAMRAPGEEEYHYNPRGHTKITEGMDIVVVGTPEAIQKIEKHFGDNPQSTIERLLTLDID